MITEYILDSDDNKIRIDIVRSRRKTMGIEIKNGSVKARVPNRVSDREIIAFLEKYSKWILNKISRQAKKKENSIKFIPPENLTPCEKEKIKQAFSERVEYYAKIMSVEYGRITIRNQKTIWGSCSGKRNLNFNYRLYYLPKEVMDYVIVHELCHIRHMNHSKAFWNEVGKYFSDFVKCRNELKEIEIE